MLWLGIGVVIIGLAFLIVAIVLIKPLMKLSDVFGSLQKTTDTLPKTVTDLTDQTKNAIGTGIETLNQVNTQAKELNPIFKIIGDVGRATNQLSHSIALKVDSMKAQTASTNDFTSRYNLEGFYGVVALAYLLMKKK